ncbi:LOW QUALITY PROTEIN: protein PEAK3 [Megaptera novaeangliae]
MSNPEPPTRPPGANAPTWLTQPTYSNLGEVRARLLPSQVCCSRTSERPATDPQPLPKKTLTRAQSLPTHKSPSPGPTRAGQPQKPLLGSRSVDESQAGDDRAGTACPPAELPFFSLDTELGLSLAALEARQLEGLRAVYARLLGGLPGPCRPGRRLRLLDSSPRVESWDALYYRSVRRNKEAWLLLAANVPKPGADEPHPCGLGPQASLARHFNFQELCGLAPEGALPETPWSSPVALAADVPELTVVQWLVETGAQLPEECKAVALLLLPLERPEAQAAALAELRPENLLLAAPRGCSAARPQRLLLVDFGAAPRDPPAAHARQLGRPLRELLGPGTPLATSLAVGLEHLVAQLARARPSAAGMRGALQVLLWGPGPQLRGHGAPLGSWLRMRHALLVLHLARAVGGEVPSLEDWLCCEYLAKATEDSLYLTLELLWN